MSPAPNPDFDAVSLDAGGVLVVPDHGFLAYSLDKAGVSYDRGRFTFGHYLGVHEVDRCLSRAEDFTDYLRGFLEAVGVVAEQLDQAREAIEVVFDTPIWCQPVPGTRRALQELAAAGVRLAVTSNSDGTVADVLGRHEILQIGDGPGASVEFIGDSGHLGAAKPDPVMFHATADALALTPDRILHVGDSVHYDVAGAVAAGMQALHFDPYDLCDDATHGHLRSLADLVPPGG